MQRLRPKLILVIIFATGVQDDLRNYKNAITAVTLRAHPSSRGSVRLTGTHPQDTLAIQKNQFQNGDEGKKDLAAMVDGVKRVRETFSGNPSIAQHINSEYLPGESILSNGDLEQFVYENVFGHHACCTNAMGGDNGTTVFSSLFISPDRYSLQSLAQCSMHLSRFAVFRACESLTCPVGEMSPDSSLPLL